MGSVTALSACLSRVLGVLLLSLIPANQLMVAPPLLAAACYYAIRQRVWITSEKAQPWRQSVKILILAAVKLLNMCLLVYFAHIGQPYM
jgi:hypothetical protein